MKRRKSRPVYKEYTMGQIVLLPTNLDELITENHLVRVIHQFVERMDLAPLEAKYKGGGTSSYHPKMMLKVYLYAYTQKIYSSRRIAKALRESIPFLWLSGNNRPDFRTINYFRGHILKGLIDEIFVALLVVLVEDGYIRLEDYFVDGTKIEANANRYSFVWAKNTQRYKQQLSEKVAGLMQEIEQLNQAEDERYGEGDLEEVGENRPIDSQKLAERVNQLNEQLKGEPVKPDDEPEANDPPEGGAGPASLSEEIADKLQEVKQALEAHPDDKHLKQIAKQMESDYLPRAQKYEAQERNLAGRNSYSKTDVDATFMRMKEDHMRNGQLKPGYNIQLGTENQFVVGFSLHQQAGDATCLIPHLAKLKDWLKRLPDHIGADAAYGNEANYAYLAEENVTGNYLKYSGFDREQKPRYKPDPFKVENLIYDAPADDFICPQGERLHYRYTTHTQTKTGYRSELRVYECKNCQGCPVKAKCTKAAGNRQVRANFLLWAYRQWALENLVSEKGQAMRDQRGVDVETVFGRIKNCWDFRRFLLRGLEKVSVEWGLLCLAHNLAKVWNAQNGPNLVTA
jgi:transposase